MIPKGLFFRCGGQSDLTLRPRRGQIQNGLRHVCYLSQDRFAVFRNPINCSCMVLTNSWLVYNVLVITPRGKKLRVKIQVRSFSMTFWKRPKSGCGRVITYRYTYIYRFSRPLLSLIFHTEILFNLQKFWYWCFLVDFFKGIIAHLFFYSASKGVSFHSTGMIHLSKWN